MHQGKTIEYIDQGRIICSLCLQDKGSRLALLTTQNREINLSLKRVFLISTSTIDPIRPREGLIIRLRQIEELRKQLKNEVNVSDLWELVRDENESFDFKYLTHLCFGEDITDDHISGLVRALFEDNLYFKIKDGRFIPCSEKKIEQIILQREEERIKEEKIRIGSSWLRDVLQNKKVQDPEEKQQIVSALIDLVLYGKESLDFNFSRELLTRTGVTDTQETRKILVRLGVWDKDEPLELLRLKIRTVFSDRLIREAEVIKEETEFNTLGREDLRDLECFTIDGSHTKDFDDALSMDTQGEYTRIGIHISDVTEFVLPDSELDKEALLRASSLYLPQRQISMIPEKLSHDATCLKQGVDRPAISLLANFDRQGNLYNYRFVLSVINVKKQLTYDGVNERINEDTFSQLYRLCEGLRRKRIEQGAMILSLPDLFIEIDCGTPVSLRLLSQETPSRKMVAELMILYNWLAARFCRDNNIPTLYRTQKAPSEVLTMGDKDYTHYVFKQRRKIHRLVIDTKPAPHSGVGMDVYTAVSSPIRRYLDLAVQRQIKGFLSDGVPLYNREELDQIRMRVDPILKDLNAVRQSRIRYWILKYLMGQLNRTFNAIVIDVMKSRIRMVLTDFMFVAEMKKDAGHKLSAGMYIFVKVRKSDPWTDELQLKFEGLSKKDPEQY